MQDQLDRAADAAASEVQRAMAETQQRLYLDRANWDEGAVELSFKSGYVEASPRNRIAWRPAVRPLPEAPPALYAEGERFEFQLQDRGAAIREYRRLLRSSDPAVRAGALLRLGRCLHAAGRIDEALAAYRDLSQLDRVAVNSTPAALVGQYARCRTLHQTQRSKALFDESAALAMDLREGRWDLTEPVYQLYSRDSAVWTGIAQHGPSPQEVFAIAAAELFSKRNLLPESGREALSAGGQVLAAIWVTSAGSRRAVLVSQSFVEKHWLSAVRRSGILLSFQESPAGYPGSKTAGLAWRSSAYTGLPWALLATWDHKVPANSDFILRRRLLIAGFVLLVAMATAASYIIFHAVTRELAVARLQSDFVAAVSHEFRTPLTALRQFTDMLREKNDLTDERRRVCYDAQSRATDRLMRLVESLLDFGRMEAGVRPYRIERQDCGEVVRRAVQEFRDDPQSAGYSIEFQQTGTGIADIDPEALSRAVWNLLENAVKYSRGERTIGVRLTDSGNAVRISVRDRGIGVPLHERELIFRRFCRGDAARELGIKGTGIGLAMVSEIVRAHFGSIELDSSPGLGSTFTIILPSSENICRAS